MCVWDTSKLQSGQDNVTSFKFSPGFSSIWLVRHGGWYTHSSQDAWHRWMKRTVTTRSQPRSAALIPRWFEAGSVPASLERKWCTAALCSTSWQRGKARAVHFLVSSDNLLLRSLRHRCVWRAQDFFYILSLDFLSQSASGLLSLQDPTVCPKRGTNTIVTNITLQLLSPQLIRDRLSR